MGIQLVQSGAQMLHQALIAGTCGSEPALAVVWEWHYLECCLELGEGSAQLLGLVQGSGLLHLGLLAC